MLVLAIASGVLIVNTTPIAKGAATVDRKTSCTQAFILARLPSRLVEPELARWLATRVEVCSNSALVTRQSRGGARHGCARRRTNSRNRLSAKGFVSEDVKLKTRTVGGECPIRVNFDPSLAEEDASTKERNGASPPSFCTMGYRQLKRTYS
jgi:hypothetical protein